MPGALFRPTATLGGGAGGGVTLSACNPLSTWTTYDGSGGSILGGVAAQFASTPSRINLTLQNPAVASGGPDLGCGVFGPLAELTGRSPFRAITEDIIEHFLTALRRPGAWATDVEFFLYQYDDGSKTGGTNAPTTAMKGVGVGFVLAGGEWSPISYACAGSGTMVSDPSTLGSTTRDAEGVIGQYTAGRLASRGYHTAVAVMADGSFDTADGAAVDTTTDNFRDPSAGYFNSIAMGAGWATGVGGTGGVMPIFGSVSHLDLRGS